MFMWTQSGRAIPRSYRMMQGIFRDDNQFDNIASFVIIISVGFGVNTFALTNSKGERHFVKFIFTPELGVHSFVWDASFGDPTAYALGFQRLTIFTFTGGSKAGRPRS